jgi:hypothetical protein
MMKTYTSIEEVIEEAEQVWDEITLDILTNLSDGIIKRIQEAFDRNDEFPIIK